MSLEAALQKNTESNVALTAMLAAVIGRGLGPKVFDVEGATAGAKAEVAAAVEKNPPTVVIAANVGETKEPGPLDFENDVKPKALAASKKLGRDKFIELLAKHEVAKVSDAKPEQWPAMVKDFDAAVA